MPKSSTVVSQIVDTLKKVAGPDSAVLNEPSFFGSEWKYLKECLDSTFVSSVCKFVDCFESDLAYCAGIQYVMVEVSGISAI